MPSYPLNKIFDGYGGIYMKEELDGIDIIRSYIYPSNSVKLISRLFNYFSFVFSSLIVGLFVLPKKDILITESPPLFLGITGYVLSRVKGAKWIFNVSDLWPESAVNLGVIGKGLPLTISFKLEEFFYKKSWLVLGQSKGIVKNINERFPWVDTYLLSNGVDVEKYTPDTKSDILKEWSNGREYTVVYAGLHGIAQGLDQLIKAAKVLDSKLNTLQFVLIGDGPNRKKIEDLSVSRSLDIFCMGKVQKNSIPALLRLSDICFVSFKHSPLYKFGMSANKLWDYMMAAKPVVMSINSSNDPVLEADCGITVSSGNAIDIARAFRSLLKKSNEELKYLGENGKRYVEKNNDYKTLSEKFLLNIL